MPKEKSRRHDIDLLEHFWNEPVERQVLPNGLTLIIKPDHSAQLASVQAWVGTGSVHEGRWTGAGVSHFLEHMLFKGTARRKGREISAEVQSLGGYINAYTSFDRTVYYIDLPSENVASAVDILADSVLGSTLPEDEFARERDVILREIAMTRDDPDQRMGEVLFDAAFREHPYRHPVIGHRDLFSRLTHADLVAYYKARYTPANLTVVVVGAVDPAAVRASVEATFGAVPRSSLEPVLVPAEPLQMAARTRRLSEDVEVTRAGLAWQVPGLTHPDAPLLDLLATVLGGGDSSILWQSLREKQRLVHSIDAQCWNPGDTGLFYVFLTCEPARREAALAAVRRELASIASKGVPAARIRRAIRQLVVAEINTRKTMSGQASRLGAAEVVAGDLQFGRGYFERLRSASPAQLRRVVREHLLPLRVTEVSMDPKGAAVSAASAPARVGAAPDFELITLPNGARIAFQPDSRLPSLHLRLVAAGGPSSETPGRRGSASLLATLLTKDTRRRSSARVAEDIEGVGGSFFPFCGNNSLGLGVELLSTDAERALRALTEAVLEPAFLPDTLATEREALLAELSQDNDDIATRGRKLLRRRFFGGYPLSHDAHGDEAGVSATTPAVLRDLHGRLFRAENLVLAVSGDFEPSRLLPRLERLMLRMPAGPGPSAPPPFTPPAALELREHMQKEQAVVFEAYPGPVLMADDFYAGEVADELFSGMASRLFERVREEKGLAYFVRSARVTGLGGALFYFYAGTAPDKAAEVLGEIEAEVDRVAAGDIGRAEIDRCLARLRAGRRQSMQTIGARSLNAALNVLLGLPVNDWRNYDARISAIGAAELSAFARKYLRREHRMRLVIGP